MTPTEQDKELRTLLRTLLGEMPNFVIDWLELSDDLRNEWKKGGKASDFGGHRAFIQKYEEKLTKLITADRKCVELEARKDELSKAFTAVVGDKNAPSSRYSKVTRLFNKYLLERHAELKAQQEEVR